MLLISWSVAIRFTALGLSGATERIEQETKRDNSDRAKRNLETAHVAGS